MKGQSTPLRYCSFCPICYSVIVCSLFFTLLALNVNNLHMCILYILLLMPVFIFTRPARRVMSSVHRCIIIQQHVRVFTKNEQLPLML